MRRLLLAEDDRDLRELLSAILEADGATVVAVSNGREAMDHLRRDGSGFHAAILDVRMPLMTGLDVLRESRRLESVVPIVLVTSFADDELRERARELGAACVINKPLDPEHLRQAVGRFARRAGDAGDDNNGT
ncbi:hypothetical protein BH11MYX4_BH11MYX4_06310 [soil metagenome]